MPRKSEGLTEKLQIMITPVQKRKLLRVAKREKVNFSTAVRTMVDVGLADYKEKSSPATAKKTSERKVASKR